MTLHDVQFHHRYMFADCILLCNKLVRYGLPVVVSCLELALALSCLIAGSCLITELEGRENPFHLKSEVESNIVSWWSRISSLIRWFQAIWWTSLLYKRICLGGGKCALPPPPPLIRFASWRFKGGPPAYTEVGEKMKFQKKQRCSKSDLKLFFERFEK